MRKLVEFITLDLDYNDKVTVGRVLRKLSEECSAVMVAVSPGLNGYHVTLLAEEDRGERLVFDDQRRAAADYSRANYTGNVLFTRKMRLR